MNLDAVQHRVQDAWVRQDWHDWAATCAPTYRFLLTPSFPALDASQTVAWSRAWFAAFPDYTEQVRGVYSTDRAVAYELIGSGTAMGDLIFGGRIVTTCRRGSTFVLPYVKVLVVNDGGLVEEDRQYLDVSSLENQVR
ncbi:ester cyclase [Gordonia sp. CPCC 205333]|uniref:ester cyclase n=1 Tax=Gordonia sp. CPCC 205333 TaxID=3140790 RepID=UPI003AF352B3